uniref:C2H2-type domain-containing protein n=1 Tax=Kalanchoe fedtschenkoi TaxID=63787 RepID=A0A7N0T0S0_KALFE
MEGRNASRGSPSNVSEDHKRDGEDSSDRRGNNQERSSSDSSRHGGERRLNVDEIVITMITLVAIATSGNVVVHDQSWMTAAIVQSESFIPPPPPPAPAPAPAPTRVINNNANNDAIPPPEEGCSSGQSPPNKKRKRAEHQEVHECGICGKVFSTGQALGGHMRAHYPGHLSRTRHANSNVAIASSAASVAAPSSYSGATINNNNNNNINSEVDAEVNDESTVVEHNAANESDRAASHPRLDIDLNVKPAEMSEEPEEENLEEEGHHSYGD